MNQISMHAKLVILFVLTWSIVACRTKHPPPDIKGLNVLSDFVFVGSIPCTLSAESGIASVQTIVFQAAEPQPLPKSLEVGRAYFFHRRKPFDDETFALSDFPSRLRSAGLKLVHAPQSPRDLIASYIGGPFFRINYKNGPYTCFLLNWLSTDYQKQVDSGWKGEDYILACTQ